MWRRFYVWRVVNSDRISVAMLILNLAAPFIIIALVALGWLAVAEIGSGLLNECGSGYFKWEC